MQIYKKICKYEILCIILHYQNKNHIMKNTNKFKALALTAILCFAAQTAKSQLEQSVYLNAGIPTS